MCEGCIIKSFNSGLSDAFPCLIIILEAGLKVMGGDTSAQCDDLKKYSTPEQ